MDHFINSRHTLQGLRGSTNFNGPSSSLIEFYYILTFSLKLIIVYLFLSILFSIQKLVTNSKIQEQLATCFQKSISFLGILFCKWAIYMIGLDMILR